MRFIIQYEDSPGTDIISNSKVIQIIIDQINTALLSIINIFEKHFKNLTFVSTIIRFSKYHD